MLPKKQSKVKQILNLVAFFILLIASAAIIYYRQFIVDYIAVIRFLPSSEVSTLSSRVDFSDHGQFIFYASQPELNEAARFNDSCQKIEKTSSILGCYSDYKIYIYNINDSRLDGIREVTAAHEMLHAAYDRLDKTKKDELEQLLELEYQKLSKEEDFVDLMAFYARTEPGEKYNELHSIVGTIVRNLDPKLEDYYSKYFDNRQDVVSYYEAYNGVFKDLSDRANVLSQKLDSLSLSIPLDSENYNKMVRELNEDISVFNKKAESGDFDSWAQFYSERTFLEGRVEYLSDMRDKINSDIDDYNKTLEDYNSVAIESQNLYNVINSTLVEAQSI